MCFFNLFFFWGGGGGGGGGGWGEKNKVKWCGREVLFGGCVKRYRPDICHNFFRGCMIGKTKVWIRICVWLCVQTVNRKFAYRLARTTIRAATSYEKMENVKRKSNLALKKLYL